MKENYKKIMKMWCVCVVRERERERERERMRGESSVYYHNVSIECKLTAPGLARNPYIAATYVNSIRQMRAIAYWREREM